MLRRLVRTVWHRLRRVRNGGRFSTFGLGLVNDTAHTVSRKAWDFDDDTVSGVTIAFDGHTWWVESWRRGQIVSSLDCPHWREACEQAALEVPAYLSWRRVALGAQGRSAQIFVPLPGHDGSVVEALVVERSSAEAVVLVQVAPGREPFSDRVRVAARSLFNGGGSASLPAPAYLQNCVCVGVVRDCGHLSVTPQTGPSLRALMA